MRVSTGKALLVACVLPAPLTASAQNVDWATCDYTTVRTTNCVTAGVSSCCTMSDSDLKVGNATATLRPVIIPMDRCHQPLANSGVNGPPGTAAPDNASNGWCVDPPTTSTNGMFYAYGLVYRLMQKSIPVYWVVNPTKNGSAVASWASSNKQRFRQSTIDIWVMTSDTTVIPTSPANLTDCPSGTCTPPVTRLNSTTLAAATDSPTRYSKKEFP